MNANYGREVRLNGEELERARAAESELGEPRGKRVKEFLDGWFDHGCGGRLIRAHCNR